MKIFTFTLANQSGRPFKISIPAHHIHTIETQAGSENVFCKVNGVEVDYSYETLMRELGNI